MNQSSDPRRQEIESFRRCSHKSLSRNHKSMWSGIGPGVLALVGIGWCGQKLETMRDELRNANSEIQYLNEQLSLRKPVVAAPESQPIDLRRESFLRDGRPASVEAGQQ